MAGGKETPRQKMIGMMYLVLLAMLAMNVSKDILNAFVVINDSLETTTENSDQKNASTIAAFQKQMAIDPSKTQPFFEKASDAKMASDSAVAYIESLKKKLVIHTAGYEGEVPDSLFLLKNIDGKDNYDKPSEFLIGSEPAFPKGGPYTAVDLKQKLIALKEDLMGLFNPEKDSAAIHEIKRAFDLAEVPKPDGGTESWETGNFNHMPLAACITTLTKLQSDVRNAEGFVLRTLFSKINELDFKFDKIEAKIIPRSSYVLQGENYEADVFLAAYSSTEQPQMLLGDYDSISNTLTSVQDSLSVENGLGKLMLPASQVGLKSYNGMIKLKQQDGSIKSFPFTGEYIVAEPTLTVSPTEMNVLYKGIDNPLEISVPGVPTGNIQVSISGGNQLVSAAGQGTYTAKMSPNSPRDVEVSVMAKMPDGSMKNMGSRKFRVKNLPKPYPQICEISESGRISAQGLIACQGIRALYGEDFNFNITAKVTDFRMQCVYNGRPLDEPSNSNRFTQRMIDILTELRPGTQVTFTKIHGKGPDGLKRDMSPIVITLI